LLTLRRFSAPGGQSQQAGANLGIPQEIVSAKRSPQKSNGLLW
jgi:hypothetical protein